MILMQNIIDDDDCLLTVLMNRYALKDLDCKCDDYLSIMQSHHNPYYFLIVKCDSRFKGGYRVRRHPAGKGIYQINVRFRFRFIKEFDLTECTYFVKKNNAVRVILKGKV